MKTFTFIGKLLLSVVAATGLGCIGMMQDWRGEAIVAAFLFGGVLIALALGVFDISDTPTSKHTSIKNASRSMRRAA